MNGCEIICADPPVGNWTVWACCKVSSQYDLVETMCDFFEARPNTKDYHTCVHNVKYPECTFAPAIEAACVDKGIDPSAVWESVAEERMNDI